MKTVDKAFVICRRRQIKQINIKQFNLLGAIKKRKGKRPTLCLGQRTVWLLPEPQRLPDRHRIRSTVELFRFALPWTGSQRRGAVGPPVCEVLAGRSRGRRRSIGCTPLVQLLPFLSVDCRPLVWFLPSILCWQKPRESPRGVRRQGLYAAAH